MKLKKKFLKLTSALSGLVNKNLLFFGLLSVTAILLAIFGYEFFIFLSDDFISAEVVAIPVVSNYFESGFITPASCGVCFNMSDEGFCRGDVRDIGHPEWGGACSPPSCTPSCGAWSGCSASCGGGTQSRTCTASNCSTYTETQSCNAQSCLPPPGTFGLGGAASSCNSIVLSWTTASSASGYRIFRNSVDISPYQPYTALNFVDTTVSQNTVYLYRVDAYNSVGTRSSNTINVTTPYCSPTVNLSGNPLSIYQGQSSTLSWDSANATSCTASSNPTQSDWNGSKSLNNSVGQVVKPLPPPQVIYALQCSGLGGSTQKSIIIQVLPLALPNWREIIPR